MVRKGRRENWILWGGSLLWLGLCLFLSWQTGNDTTGLSEQITGAIAGVLRILGIGVVQAALNIWLRKIAHFAIFFVAGILFYAALRRSLTGRPHREWLCAAVSMAGCSLCAVVAEVGKLWIPGRHLQWDETLLNVVGVAAGVGLAEICWRLWHRGGKQR